MRVGEERVLEDGTKVSLSKGEGDLIAVTISKPTPAPTPKPNNLRKESSFFTFDLQGCKLSGTSVICDFIITNTDKDRKLIICKSSEIYDDFNNKSRASSTELADSRSGGTGCAGTILISGVPTKARLTFDKVSAEATKITLLKLSSNREVSIEYRNIPLR